MAKIELTSFEKKEINNISGKGIYLKKIRIPNEDCSNFFIRYKITNLNDNSTFSSPILCLVSPYQRDITEVFLNKSIIVPINSLLELQMESVTKPSFSGTAYIEYDIFIPNEELKNMVFITEKDRQNAFRVALINLARFFNIENWEFDDNQILYNKIKLQITDPIVELLKEYFKAYDEWFKFYARIKEIEQVSGKRHELNGNEQIELSNLIKRREMTLEALQKRFDELQFERFKKLRGLENVDGLML